MTTLSVGGREFACISELPAGLLLDLAASISEGGMSVIAQYRSFIYAAVVPEEREALRETLNRTENIVSLNDLNEAVGGLLVQYIGRPTSPVSASPVGSEQTTGMPRVMSLDVAGREQVAAFSSENGQAQTP
jgi:hypothetical protein